MSRFTHAGHTSALSKSLGTPCFAQSGHNPPNKLMECESREAPTSPPPPPRVSGAHGGPGSTDASESKAKKGGLVLRPQVICLLLRSAAAYTHSVSWERSPERQKKVPHPVFISLLNQQSILPKSTWRLLLPVRMDKQGPGLPSCRKNKRRHWMEHRKQQHFRLGVSNSEKQLPPRNEKRMR